MWFTGPRKQNQLTPREKHGSHEGNERYREQAVGLYRNNGRTKHKGVPINNACLNSLNGKWDTLPICIEGMFLPHLYDEWGTAKRKPYGCHTVYLNKRLSKSAYHVRGWFPFIRNYHAHMFKFHNGSAILCSRRAIMPNRLYRDYSAEYIGERLYVGAFHVYIGREKKTFKFIFHTCTRKVTKPSGNRLIVNTITKFDKNITIWYN